MDQFGQGFGFSINSGQKRTTLFGGVLTVASFTMIIAYFALQLAVMSSFDYTLHSSVIRRAYFSSDDVFQLTVRKKENIGFNVAFFVSDA